MGRVWVTSGSPSDHAAPEYEYQAETWQDWLRRQQRGPEDRNKKKGRPAATGRPDAPERN